MTGRRFCFFSYELFPINAGGCGALLYNLAKKLIEHDIEIHFVLDIAGKNKEALKKEFFSGAPGFPEGGIHFHSLEDMCRDLDVIEVEFGSRFEWNSWRCAHALRQLNREIDLDYIEFFDYYGVSHYSQILKLSGLEFQNTTLAVRMHTTIEMMDGYELTNWLGLDLYRMYRLESSAIKMAEILISPSEAFMRDAVDRLYPNRMGSNIVCPPPVGRFAGAKQYVGSQDRNIVLFYGRMYGIKGVDLFVDTAIEILSSGPSSFDFYIVGGDSLQPPVGVGEYKKYLLDRIPENVKHKFHFTGHLPHQAIVDILDKTIFAVFPSYFESYGYAAREVSSAGIPVVLGEAIGFRDGHFVDGVNAIFCKQSISSLFAGMRRLLDDSELRDRISVASAACELEADIDFYLRDRNPAGSKKRPQVRSESLRSSPLVTCIVTGENRGLIEMTLASIKKACPAAELFVAFAGEMAGATKYLFLGKYVSFLSVCGDNCGQPPVGEYVAVFVEGEELEPEFFDLSLNVLQEAPKVAAVGCWVQSDNGRRFAVAQEIAIESCVVNEASTPSGFLMRNIKGKYLFDIFDAKSLHLGEVKYLADLKGMGFQVVTLPFFLSRQPKQSNAVVSNKLRSYFINSLQWNESVRCFSQLFAVGENSDRESGRVAVIQTYEPLRDRVGEKNYMMLLKVVEKILALRESSRIVRYFIFASKAISRKL